MESWLPFFVAVTALAVVLQMAILLAMYLQFRQLNERLTRTLDDFNSRMTPILTRLQVFLEDTQPRLTSIVSDASEVVHLARAQAQKADRLFTEAAERLRLQLIRADQIVGSALETVEEAGTKFRRTLWGPMQNAAALIKGIQAGLEFFRARRAGNPEHASESQQDEGLFI